MRGSLNDLINGSKPVLVDFYADWCGPCKMQTPILQQVSDEMSEKARIIKIDVDKNPTVASQFEVRGVPTLILFKNGQPVWRQSGVAGKDQLKQIINKFA
jgi:thioredoxin 1